MDISMKIEVSYHDIYIKVISDDPEYNANDKILLQIETMAKRVIDIYMAGKETKEDE